MAERDPITSSQPTADTVAVASSAVPELDRARARSVRLVISIPVLSMLAVLGSGTVVYNYLIEVGDSYFFFPATRDNIQRAAITVLWFSIGISIASAMLGYVLARSIVRPIKDLIRQMDAIISEGDLAGMQVEPIRLGELGQLGSTFNRMVEQLNRLFEERDRQLSESLGGGHLVVDGKGVVLRADEAAARLLNTPVDKLLKCNVVAANTGVVLLRENPRLHQLLTESVGNALAGRSSSRAITVRNARQEQIGRYLVSSLKLETGEGEGAHVMLEIRDITSIARFYEQIQRADRLAAVGTLATGIAHEVRNPLASIRGMTQLLAEMSHADRETWDYHQRILKEVDRVEKLIEGVMEFARTEDSAPEDIDLNQFLRDCVENCRMRLGEAADDFSITWRCEPCLPPVRLREERIRQALLNLITNALQHAHQIGNRALRVETYYNPEEAQRPVAICIANPGEAIDEQARERLFEPFYTTKPEGTGLGLPIAYQAVTSNGGTLDLECIDGEVRFWVMLPLRPQTRAQLNKSFTEIRLRELLEDSQTEVSTPR